MNSSNDPIRQERKLNAMKSLMGMSALRSRNESPTDGSCTIFSRMCCRFCERFAREWKWKCFSIVGNVHMWLRILSCSFCFESFSLSRLCKTLPRHFLTVYDYQLKEIVNIKEETSEFCAHLVIDNIFGKYLWQRKLEKKILRFCYQ